MKPLADRITEQLQAHRFGQSAKELAATLGSTSDHVWQQLKALQLAGLVARRDVGRDTVWNVNKEQTAMSIPNQVEQRLKAAGLNGMTSLQLKNFLRTESKNGVDAALQFFKRKGQVALINDRWVWVTQEEATTAANDTTPASTELLRQVLAEDKPALQVVAAQPGHGRRQPGDPEPCQCPAACPLPAGRYPGDQRAGCMSTPELDDETRARLRWEAERLAEEQEISLQRAREIVWLDYLDECGQPQPPKAEAVAEAPAAPPVETPVPEPPGTYWQADNSTFFTPERLAANRRQLAQVKQLVGLRT